MRGILLTLLLSGCVRVGYLPADDGGSPDAGPWPDAPGVDGGPVDQAVGINSPCTPGACADGLVCAGGGDMRFCRPACADSGLCADGQACGHLVVGGTTDPSAPMACFETDKVGEYESCLFAACESGMACVKGETHVCMVLCTTDSDCATDQSCYAASTAPGFQQCLYQCNDDGDCPELTHCAGFGTYPLDHCVPATPSPPHTLCTTTTVCPLRHRCVGLTADARYCYPICPSGSCPTGEICVPSNGSAAYCLAECSPTDQPTPCASYEVCYADPNTLKAYCLPATGDPDTCDATTPCESGKLCVGGSCLPACDAQHLCQSGTCKELKVGTTTAPWKACQ